jgi:hypothetical protein
MPQEQGAANHPRAANDIRNFTPRELIASK